MLVAESFSGPLAVRLAADPPPGLRGAVLVATFVRCPLAAAWLTRPLLPLIFRVPPTLWALRRLLLGEGAPPALEATLQQALASVRPAALVARAASILELDATEALRAARVPLRYLRAAGDALVGPRCAAMIQAARPDVAVRTLDGPHLLQQRAPEVAAAEIRSFTDELGAP